MFVLAPVPVTDSVLTASNLAETDHAAWGSGTAYSTGDRVIVTTTTLDKPVGEVWAAGDAIYWSAAISKATKTVIGGALIGYASASAASVSLTGSVAVHSIYEATAGSTGNNPVPNSKLEATDPARTWIRVGATNRWRPFDRTISDPATNSGDITYTLTVPSLTTGIAFFGLEATSVTVEVQTGAGATVGTETLTLSDTTGITDWYTFFTWDPVGGGTSYQTEALFTELGAYAGYKLLVTLSGSTVAVGEIVMGQIFRLGTTLVGTEVGFEDYSGKGRDDFQHVILIEREYSDWANFRFGLAKRDVLTVKRIVASLRATPAVWYSSEDTIDHGSIVYGFPTGGLRVPLEGAGYHIASLEIEGLT